MQNFIPRKKIANRPLNRFKPILTILLSLCLRKKNLCTTSIYIFSIFTDIQQENTKKSSFKTKLGRFSPKVGTVLARRMVDINIDFISIYNPAEGREIHGGVNFLSGRASLPIWPILRICSEEGSCRTNHAGRVLRSVSLRSSPERHPGHLSDRMPDARESLQALPNNRSNRD